MGFRDFEAFNQALLAKQAWRIVTNPNSLCARVLKARYFANSDFLQASCPKSASYTWQSILFGRDLLQAGLIWRIGNGKNINVWTDNWIPRQGLLKPMGALDKRNITKVADLMNYSGKEWDVAKLKRVLLPGDVEDIMRIPIGGANREDFYAWNYTKNGVFSVRSAYHFCMDMKNLKVGKPESSSSVAEHNGWLELWDTNVPAKAKIHVWRLAQNGLAVGSELQRRNIKSGVACPVCEREETVLHRFWVCPYARHCWALVNEARGDDFFQPTSDWGFAAGTQDVDSGLVW